jgi:hypothetical protein
MDGEDRYLILADKLLDHGILRYHLDKKGFQETLVLRFWFAKMIKKEVMKWKSSVA